MVVKKEKQTQLEQLTWTLGWKGKSRKQKVGHKPGEAWAGGIHRQLVWDNLKLGYGWGSFFHYYCRTSWLCKVSNPYQPSLPIRTRPHLPGWIFAQLLYSFSHLKRPREQIGEQRLGQMKGYSTWPAAIGEQGITKPLAIWNVLLAQMEGAMPCGKEPPFACLQTHFSQRRRL